MSCANDRLMFPNLGLFKKTVAEKFILVTRYIYTKHPIYTFSQKEEESEILIYPAYADKTRDGKQPKIVVKVGSYNFGLNDTLGNNFSGEIRDERNKVVGMKRDQVMNFQISVLIQAYTEEESSDIADELSQFIIFVFRKLYGANGIIPQTVQVSETDLINQEQGIFQTSISGVYQVPWVFREIQDAITIINTFFQLEGEKLLSDDYVAPGVNIEIQRTKTHSERAYVEPGVDVEIHRQNDQTDSIIKTFGGRNIRLKD